MRAVLAEFEGSLPKPIVGVSWEAEGRTKPTFPGELALAPQRTQFQVSTLWLAKRPSGSGWFSIFVFSREV